MKLVFKRFEVLKLIVFLSTFLVIAPICNRLTFYLHDLQS